MNVYLCVTIDSECDKGAEWKTRKPLAFDGVREGMVKRLQPLFNRYRAKPTYLLSPEVIAEAGKSDLFAGLRGDYEFGAHLHGEFIGPNPFVPDVTLDFQCNYTVDIEREKLRNLTKLFRDVLGHRPTSFRAGRFGIGAHSLELLSELGYMVESSVTPWVDWSEKGARDLNHIGAPTQPYHPDPRWPARPGSSSLLEVPITIRPRATQRLPLIGRIIEPRWLRPTWGTVESLRDIMREEIWDAQTRYGVTRPVILNCMFHNVEVIPNASPYAANEEEAQRILSRLEGVLSYAEHEKIRCIGLSDVLEVLA